MVQRTVKIAEPLALAADEYVGKMKDEFGLPKFKSRADFVETAVRDLLRKLPALPKEAQSIDPPSHRM